MPTSWRRVLSEIRFRGDHLTETERASIFSQAASGLVGERVEVRMRDRFPRIWLGDEWSPKITIGRVFWCGKCWRIELLVGFSVAVDIETLLHEISHVLHDHLPRQAWPLLTIKAEEEFQRTQLDRWLDSLPEGARNRALRERTAKHNDREREIDRATETTLKLLE